MDISLETARKTARKLKKAGLVWEPQAGDLYYWSKFDNPVLVMHSDSELLKKEQKTKGIVWAPRLSQLLAEIERRGFDATLHVSTKAVVLRDEDTGTPLEWFIKANSLAENAAEALLWILEREQND